MSPLPSAISSGVGKAYRPSGQPPAVGPAQTFSIIFLMRGTFE